MYKRESNGGGKTFNLFNFIVFIAFHKSNKKRKDIFD